MTNRSETKAYFFRSLRISFSAARWSVWTGPTCRGPHLRIDSAPEVDHAAGDFQIRLIQMPGAVWLGAALAQIGCDHRSEIIHPAPNGLVRDQNPALRQQVFHIAKAEREPKIQPYRLAYNLRREEVAGLADFLHSIRYRAARPIASPKRRDGATSPARHLAQGRAVPKSLSFKQHLKERGQFKAIVQLRHLSRPLGSIWPSTSFKFTPLMLQGGLWSRKR